MQWVFAVLFICNGVSFLFGFFLLRPIGELELIEPSPLASQPTASMIVLLKESRLAATSEEPVGNSPLDIEPRPNFRVEDPVPKQDSKSRAPVKCFKLGPFPSTLDADTFHAQVGLSDGAWKIDDQSEAVDASYWVYIPPAATREESLTSLRNLQMMGVDSFVVSRGEYTNAISLGTFQKQDSADALKEQVTALGFDVSLLERARTNKTIWLYLQANSYRDQKVIEKKATGNIHASIFSCEMFAEEQILP